MRSFRTIALCIFSMTISAVAIARVNLYIGLTSEQIDALKRFPDDKRRDLGDPLMVRFGTARPIKFVDGLLYEMHDFRVLQKVSGGYLVTPNAPPMSGLSFDAAFLKTSIRVPSPDALISGLVIHDGDVAFTGTDGFDKQVPAVKLLDGFPLTGEYRDGRAPEKYGP